MYATKAQRCIRSASLELPLRTTNGVSIRHQRARYASSDKSALPDWSSQASTPERRTSLKPGMGYFMPREEKTADEPSSHPTEMPAEQSVTVGARKRRRDRHDRYTAWLAERMAEDKSLETKSDLERKEIYWKEVECHILPDEFMPVRLRRHKAQEVGLPGPRMFVVRRTSQGPVKPQFEEHNLPPLPDLTARPDCVETSKETLASPRMRFRPLQETVKEVEASGAEPQYPRITVERAIQGTLQPSNETQSLPPCLKSEARPDVLHTSLDNLSPRERALQLQLARKGAEALKIKGKQVGFEHQYKHRCSWCGSPAHTRATCGLLQADIEDGLCHVADGKVFVGRPWEGGPPIFRMKGLGEGTPLRNRLPRNPRPHVPRVQFVGATGRPGQERPAAIRKFATEVSDPFSAPPKQGLPQETLQPPTAWPTLKPAKEPNGVSLRYFSPLPAEKAEKIDAERLLPPKIKPENRIGENHEVLPIHKVPIDPGVPRDKMGSVRDSVGRRQEKRENSVARVEFEEDDAMDYPEEYEPEIPAPEQPEQIYHTDLSDSIIYDGTITSLKPSTLRSLAIEPAVPFLIRHPGSPDLASLASSSGMPAISTWFNPPPSPSLTSLQREEYSPFTSFLNSLTCRQVVMPYEFLTPTIPTVNDGNHDLLSSFLFPAHPSLVPFTPPPGTLSSLLSDCLSYLAGRPHLDQDIWYEAIADDTRRRLAFLEVKDGKPLTDIQWQTLRRWGPMFQRFNAFQAPMELLIKAAEPVEESGSTAPGLGGLYVAQAQLADLPEDLQAHLPLPKVLAELYAGEEGKTRAEADIYGSNLWMGTPPTFTPLHKDPNPNFFVQLRGQKVIKLLSPAKGQEVYARVHRRIAEEKGNGAGAANGAIRGEEMMQGLERAELEKSVWTEDGSEERIGETVVLGPGDAVYIPKGWWHSVKSVGEGLNASVNWWFR